VRLPDERLLLVVGGELDGPSGRTNTCEIYDPLANTWTMTGSFNLPTEIPPTFMLYTDEVFKSWRYPEIYNLGSGLWRADPNMVQGRNGAAAGGHCDHEAVMLEDGRIPSAVTKVVLVGARNSTHWVDGGPQRTLPLSFTQTGSSLNVTLPSDTVRLLPGYYLLASLTAVASSRLPKTFSPGSRSRKSLPTRFPSGRPNPLKRRNHSSGHGKPTPPFAVEVPDRSRPDPNRVPVAIRYRSPEPVLSPELSKEREGIVPNVVFPTAIDRRDDLGLPDRFDVYYGMADSCIGVARLDLPAILPDQAKP